MTTKVITQTEVQFVIDVLSRIHARLFDGEDTLDAEDDKLLQEIDDAADMLYAIVKRPNQELPENEYDEGLTP